VFGPIGVEVLLVLVVLAFLGGIVVATIGPGGILIVTGLYLLTSLSSAEVAGTSSATFTVGAVLGSTFFACSGEIDWRIAGIVSASAAVGTWFGVQANAYLSRELYGLVLAALLAAVGCNIVYREYRDLEPRFDLGREGLDLAAFVAIGLVIGVFGGSWASAGRRCRHRRSYSSASPCSRRSRSHRSSSCSPRSSRRSTTCCWARSSPRWSS
jgi:hypothetical protein